MGDPRETGDIRRTEAPTHDAPRSWLKRLGWLALIWTASVLTLSGVAWLMRTFMNAIGLQTS